MSGDADAAKTKSPTLACVATRRRRELSALLMCSSVGVTELACTLSASEFEPTLVESTDPVQPNESPGVAMPPTPTGGAEDVPSGVGISVADGIGEQLLPTTFGQGGRGVVSSKDGNAGVAGCSAADDAACDSGAPCSTGADEAAADRDQDGILDACDRCPDVAHQDDAADVDQDGVPDGCDPCGISVALALAPLFYFPLDEAALVGEAANLGSVPQNGSYVGPITRDLVGVADPAGRAVGMVGQQNGEFSRITLLDALDFPSTALTAMFWVRTSQTSDYTIFSYALPNSQNEFGMIVEGAAIRVTLMSSTFGSVGLDALQLADGGWHHVAFTWEETGGQFYFDSEPVGSPMATVPGTEVDEPSSLPVTGPLGIRPGGALVLGQDQDGPDTGFNVAQALQGGLDEVAIYDRVLAQEEIRRVFEATTCGERCDGADNDGDGSTDEGFIGTGPECAAASCQAISDAGHAFGTGGYYLTSAPGALTTCTF